MTDTKKVTELSEITPTFSGLGLTMKVSSNNIKLTTPQVLESDGAQTVKCECQLPGYRSYGNCSVVVWYDAPEYRRRIRVMVLKDVWENLTISQLSTFVKVANSQLLRISKILIF